MCTVRTSLPSPYSCFLSVLNIFDVLWISLLYLICLLFHLYHIPLSSQHTRSTNDPITVYVENTPDVRGRQVPFVAQI